jgi:hypothetical protein
LPGDHAGGRRAKSDRADDGSNSQKKKPRDTHANLTEMDEVNMQTSANTGLFQAKSACF